MPGKLRFLFAVHNHQPLGNFDWVIEGLLERAYWPFLRALQAFPRFKIALHLSGPLFLWLEEKAPSYVDAVGELISRGQVEPLLGGLFEPVLASIPREDRLGQLALMRERLEARFGVRVRGLWLTERVFEPGIIEDLVTAGVEYFLMDDRPFLASGLSKEALHHYFSTEEGGKRLFIFPIAKELRYLIPFRPPEVIEEYLRGIQASGKPLAIFGDDGEKFGGWPGTRKWVYEEGWLKGFFEMLEKLQQDVLEFSTFSEALDASPPAGLCYLPTSSYPEMEEWSLPPEKAIELKALKERLGEEADHFAPFIRGGHWKNFLWRYPEANLAHKKMLALSRMVRERGIGGEAQMELYAAQCNDAYWHGVFGGLYLPHLRHEVWRRLSRVEGLLREGEGLIIEALDLDLDGKEEVWAHSDRFSAILKPCEGGRLVEYTLFPYQTNFLNVLARRFEAYHADLRNQGTGDKGQGAGGVASIHERSKRADAALSLALYYDDVDRGAFVDRFFEEVDFEGFVRGKLREVGDFRAAPFSWKLEGRKATLERLGRLVTHKGAQPLALSKAFAFSSDGEIEARYELKNAGEEVISVVFGMGLDLFLASLALGGGWVEVAGRRHDLLGERDLGEARALFFFDEASGARLWLHWGETARLFLSPLQTISRSEEGFDRTTQGLTILPHWQVSLLPQQRWEMMIHWRWH